MPSELRDFRTWKDPQDPDVFQIDVTWWDPDKEWGPSGQFMGTVVHAGGDMKDVVDNLRGLADAIEVRLR